MSDTLSQLNNANLIEINNILKGLNKKELKEIANALGISLLSKYKKEDIQIVIQSYYKSSVRTKAFEKLLNG